MTLQKVYEIILEMGACLPFLWHTVFVTQVLQLRGVRDVPYRGRHRSCEHLKN